MNTKEVKIQERTFKIYKDFIACETCLRNLNQPEMHHGRYIKNYCNYYKIDLLDRRSRDFDIEADRTRAANCPYWTPCSMSIAADLTYLDPTVARNTTMLIEEQHANRLNQLFNEGKITK